MIPSLYDKFRDWSGKGSVYIISDTHFADADCPLMDPEWPAPEELVARIKKKAHKNDTLIHLGDVGDPSYMDSLKCRKVLVMGNHDQTRTRFEGHFDEIYEGALFIGEKILLSHEPVHGLDWCVNIHGHDHSGKMRPDANHLNVAANVCGYEPIDLGREVKSGLIAGAKGIHREAIDHAVQRKREREEESRGRERAEVKRGLDRGYRDFI